MAVLLSLESSTTICSAALHDDGVCLALEENRVPQSASSMLAVMVENLFRKTGVSATEVAAVAVSSGPGSYTGLRIGVATAKGFCYARNIPLISVNTLELLVRQVAAVHTDTGMLCPMLDARRMEVYCMLSDRDGSMLEPVGARVIDEQSFGQWLERGVVTFFGNGAEKCKTVIRHSHARFLDGVVPLASMVGVMAQERFTSRRFEDLSEFEPFYLKDFMIKKPN